MTGNVMLAFLDKKTDNAFLNFQLVLKNLKIVKIVIKFQLDIEKSLDQLVFMELINLHMSLNVDHGNYQEKFIISFTYQY